MLLFYYHLTIFYQHLQKSFLKVFSQRKVYLMKKTEEILDKATFFPITIHRLKIAYDTKVSKLTISPLIKKVTFKTRKPAGARFSRTTGYAGAYSSILSSLRKSRMGSDDTFGVADSGCILCKATTQLLDSS